MLIYISALKGAEACKAIANLLRHAAAGCGSVHVVLPALRELADARPQRPGSLGHQPVTAHVMHDIDKLHQAARFRAFHQELVSSNVKVHSLDDATGLEAMVEALIMSEVLAA